ncbi:MAG: hypothetical protein ACOC4M_02805 [Promethearchaeia archaeon]
MELSDKLSFEPRKLISHWARVNNEPASEFQAIAQDYEKAEF